MTPVFGSEVYLGVVDQLLLALLKCRCDPRIADGDFPEDVTSFIGSTNFETVFLNAALPLCAGIMQIDK